MSLLYYNGVRLYMYQDFLSKTLNILILIKGNHAVECVEFAYIEMAQVLAPSKRDKVTKASDMETVYMLVAFCS